jgi:2-polyprenyl-3-methyl-5-hydroxy-6-metoxy-1,4-benzoquinol methylase
MSKTTVFESASAAPHITRAPHDPRTAALPAGLDTGPEAGSALLAPTDHGKRIGILVVAYNAVTTLAGVLRRIPPRVWAEVEEVVVCDDASNDATYELAVGYKTLGGLDKLTVLRNDKNLGYGGNQKLGYRHFMERGFDVVVLLHGDGQYAPEILDAMYAPIVRGEADAVFGSRMMPAYGGALKGGMPLYKYVGNKILTWFENRALGLRLTEFHSGYRAYNLDALRRIDFSRMTDGFHFDTEIIVKLHHQGFRMRENPIPTYYGDEICYVNGLKYAHDVFRSVLRYRRTVSSVARHPEYAEYFVDYPLKESRDSSHFHVLSLVGRGQDVLDVGCGRGFFARRLWEQGNRVVGVDQMEPDPDCLGSFDAFVRAGLDQGLADVVPLLGDRKFDRVLLQDILEHLPDPSRLLADCARVLRPAGEVVVSVPNVANITVRASLLLGRFEYTERGILDRTHLRFFTRRTIRRLVRESGYEIVRERTSVMPVELKLGLPATGLPMRAANRVLALLTWLMPGLFGYQHILVARPQAPPAP